MTQKSFKIQDGTFAAIGSNDGFVFFFGHLLLRQFKKTIICECSGFQSCNNEPPVVLKHVLENAFFNDMKQ